jgi:hypothetical protein
MSLLRLLNIQGIVGLAAAIALAVLLVIQRGETHHWKAESGRFEQLYTQEQGALATTVANYRAAADSARAADQANVARVTAEQHSINERTSNDYEARLAAARTLAQRLRSQDASAAADPGGGGATPVPDVPASAGRSAQSAREDQLPRSDALTATEQAIQLDELIKWVKAQAAVRATADTPVESGPDSR